MYLFLSMNTLKPVDDLTVRGCVRNSRQNRSVLLNHNEANMQSRAQAHSLKLRRTLPVPVAAGCGGDQRRQAVTATYLALLCIFLFI